MTRMIVYDPIYDVLRPSNVFQEDIFAPLESTLPASNLLTMQPMEMSSFGNLAIDMYETDDALIVEAALPGFREDEVEIEEQNGILNIRAQHRSERKEEGESWLVQERSIQILERTVPLPVEVKVDKAEATLENGVLHITLPKVAAQKSLTTRIKVSVPKLKLPKIGKKEGKVKVKKG